MTLITQKSGKDDKNTAKDSTAKGANRSRRDLPEDDYVGTPFSMSRIRSGVLQSTAVKVVLGLLIVIFAFTFLLAGIGGNNAGPGGQGRSGNETIAQVAGTNITRAEFQNSLEQQMRFASMFGQQIGPVEMLTIRQQTLQSLADQAGTIQAARDAGITVSGSEIDARSPSRSTSKSSRRRVPMPRIFGGVSKRSSPRSRPIAMKCATASTAMPSSDSCC
jgi:hypothetical protein